MTIHKLVTVSLTLQIKPLTVQDLVLRPAPWSFQLEPGIYALIQTNMVLCMQCVSSQRLTNLCRIHASAEFMLVHPWLS